MKVTVASRTKMKIFMDILIFTGFLVAWDPGSTGIAIHPFLGIVVERNPVWRGVHDATSNLFVLLLGVHLALHWGWIVRVSKRYLMEPVAALLGITGAAVQQREAKP